MHIYMYVWTYILIPFCQNYWVCIACPWISLVVSLLHDASHAYWSLMLLRHPLDLCDIDFGEKKIYQAIYLANIALRVNQEHEKQRVYKQTSSDHGNRGKHKKFQLRLEAEVIIFSYFLAQYPWQTNKSQLQCLVDHFVLHNFWAHWIKGGFNC